MDLPANTSPVIAAYVHVLNRRMGDDARNKFLLPILPRLEDTVSLNPQKLAYMAADRAVRVFSSTALEAAGFTEEAEKLRNLSEITDKKTAAAAAAAAARAARAAADADADAAWAAARAAARAAWAAARAAADAAWAADAARAARAAWAAWAAADAAAADADWKPAIKLLEDMVALKDL